MPDNVPLISRKCRPLPKGTPAMGSSEIAALLRQVPGWRAEGDTSLVRDFSFQNYYETIAFVNALAWIAHREDHHPDLVVGYNRCTVRYNTHTVGGISENDFICAAKINALVP